MRSKVEKELLADYDKADHVPRKLMNKYRDEQNKFLKEFGRRDKIPIDSRYWFIRQKVELFRKLLLEQKLPIKKILPERQNRESWYAKNVVRHR